MLKFLKRYKLVSVFIIMTIILIPFSLYQPSETDKVAVITSIGIDKGEEGIELSVNIVVPDSGQSGSNGGSSGKVKTLAAKGDDLSSAFSNIALVIGKTPGLAHCDSIIMNKTLFEENVTEYLDYFIRTNNLTSNATLIVAQESAKDIIEASAQQKGIRSISISDILTLNKRFALTGNSNIDVFYLNYFSPAAISILPVLSTGNSDEVGGQTSKGNKAEESAQSAPSDATQSNNSQNQSSSTKQQSQNSSTNKQSQSSSGDGESSGSGGESGGGESSGGESGGGDESKKMIKNEGRAVVVKNGKLIYELPGNEVQGLNLISENTNKGNIKIENVTNDLFENATLNFEVFNKKNKHNGYFINGMPVYNLKLTLVLKLEEAVMKNLNIEAMQMPKDFMYGQIKTKVDEAVQKNIAALINSSKTNKADVLGVYDYFYKFHHNDWLNFIKGLQDKEDYLNYVTFTCEIKTQGKI